MHLPFPPSPFAVDNFMGLAGRGVARSPMQANLAFLQAEERTAAKCSGVWTSLRKFESYFPNVVSGAQLNEQYVQSRPQCLALAKRLADSLGLSVGLAQDAILMLDRLVHHRGDLFSEVQSAVLLPASTDVWRRPVGLGLLPWQLCELRCRQGAC